MRLYISIGRLSCIFSAWHFHTCSMFSGAGPAGLLNGWHHRVDWNSRIFMGHSIVEANRRCPPLFFFAWVLSARAPWRKHYASTIRTTLTWCTSCHPGGDETTGLGQQGRSEPSVRGSTRLLEGLVKKRRGNVPELDATLRATGMGKGGQIRHAAVELDGGFLCRKGLGVAGRLVAAGLWRVWGRHMATQEALASLDGSKLGHVACAVQLCKSQRRV